MRVIRFSILAALLTIAGFMPCAQATTESVLFSFTHATYGEPHGGVTLQGGSIFGTGSGGTSGYGQVFNLTETKGVWHNSSLVDFNRTDGAYPDAGVLWEDPVFLYGTTSGGGSNGKGTAFILSDFGGSWGFATIWTFGGSGDGWNPFSDLIGDSSGNLYGTTNGGGTNTCYCGTVFELVDTFGVWTEFVLYSFKGGSKDGEYPQSGLVMDASGHLYGVTTAGGACKYCGVIYELTPSGTKWTEKILYKFANGASGTGPNGPLVMDSSGALYGTTQYSGDNKCGGGLGCGTVFMLSQSGGVWTEKTLHEFTGGSDGNQPTAGLAISPTTNQLYGTTGLGGGSGCGGSGCGTVFEEAYSGGKWTESILHSFGGKGDGTQPEAPITFDSSGNLYGTTYYGGAYNDGAVFEIVP